jgi:hypothetical protein
VVLVLFLSLGVAAPSFAASQRTSRSIQARFDDEGWATFTPQSCSPAQQGVCKINGEGMVTYTGDLVGFSEYHAYGWFDPAIVGMRFQVWETFTGTIVGCGPGSVRWYAEGQITKTGFNPVTMTAPFTQRWRLLQGTGTGALARATGAGTAGGPMNVMTRANHGTMTGRVACGGAR